MAGDWIKMRVGLQYGDPHVVRILSALNADTNGTGVRILSDRLRVIGGLHAVWCIFDQYSSDGKLTYTPQEMDVFVGWNGFTQAMIDVGWMEFDGAKILTMHNFEAHNGKSAKRRASEAMRKHIVRNVSAPDADDLRTREEVEKSKKRGADSTTNGTPGGFHELQYAARLMEEINMAKDRSGSNLQMVAAGIKSEESLRGGLAQAYEYVLAKAKECIAKQGNVTAFWFKDTKWREAKSAGPTPLPPNYESAGAKRKRELAQRKGSATK